MGFFTAHVRTRHNALLASTLVAVGFMAAGVIADEVPVDAPATIAGPGLDLFDSATAVDINGDRVVDALYSFRDRNTGDYGIAWNESDTAGTNGPDPLTRWLVVEGNSDSWDALAVADFDQDGDLDVAAVEEDRIVLFANETGVGHTGDWEDFTVATALPASAGVLGSADMDRDGDPDLVGYIASGVFSSRLGWIENLGRDDSGIFPVWTFAEHAIEANDDAEHAFLRVADIDGDGDADVVARVELPTTPPLSEFRVVWYENRVGAGASWLRHDIVASGSAAEDVRAIAVGDIDGDGDRDVVFARDLNQDLVWYANQGNGASWSSAQLINDGAVANEFRFALAIGDVDQDGDTDIVQGASGSFSAHRVVWYDNEASDGTAWTEYTLTQDGYGTNAVDIRDLDDDGDHDVLIGYTGDESNAPRVAWLENRAIHARAAYYERLVTTVNANGAIHVAAADFDGDGDQDIVGVGKADARVEWYENDGTPAGQGDWTAHFVANAPQYPRAVSAVDIDRDGDADLAVVTSDSGFIGGPGDLVWYENNDGAGGSWTTHTVDDTLSFASSLASADVDGDGDTDIVTAIGSALVVNPGRVLWFDNTVGDGSAWTRRTVGTVTNSSPRVSIGDLDRDGDTDITVATYSNDTVSWFENTGSGWTPHAITSDADGARATWVADIDGDGDNDVLSASALDDTVGWYANLDSNGLFGSRQIIDDAVSGAYFVFGADLDADADADVLAAAPGSGTIAWYENDGNGSFGSAQFVTTVADAPRAVAVADIDADGRADVLSASENDDTIAWHRNVGGQLSLPTTDTAPTTLASGRADDFLRFIVRHNGRAGDPGLALDALHLRFERANGTTMSAAEFIALVSALRIYADVDGSGDWGVPPDLAFNTVGPFFFPTGPAEGIVTFPGGLTLDAGQETTLFLVLTLESDAHLQNPNALRAVHLTASSSSGSYSDYDIDVTVEAAPNVASTVVTATAADSDGDGIADANDNCTQIANADQRDTNGDGFGNICDPDLNNDGIVNSIDLGLLKAVFFTADADADFDGSGAVNAVDLGVMKTYFFMPPGPSGIAP